MRSPATYRIGGARWGGRCLCPFHRHAGALHLDEADISRIVDAGERVGDHRASGDTDAAAALLAAAAAFVASYVLLYTSFFTNPRGLIDSVRTFLLWTGRGVEGAGHAAFWEQPQAFNERLRTFEVVEDARDVLDLVRRHAAGGSAHAGELSRA